MKRILVIGGTGNVGRAVLDQLPATDIEARAVVRNPAKASLPPHVDVVRGDLTQPDTLDACLDGVEAVLLVWTAPPTAIDAAVERIVKQARRIVFLSSPRKTPHPFFQGGQPNMISVMHARIEELIEASGREWTFLRPGIFAANARDWWGPQIRAGDVVRWPYLDVPTAPVDERDIAAVAVRALCEDGHAGAEYVLTGSQALTQREHVGTIGRVIGRSLRAEEMTPEQARQELGMPPVAVNMLLGAWSAALGHPALVTSTISEVTGRPARSFADWATDNARSF